MSSIPSKDHLVLLRIKAPLLPHARQLYKLVRYAAAGLCLPHRHGDCLCNCLCDHWLHLHAGLPKEGRKEGRKEVDHISE